MDEITNHDYTELAKLSEQDSSEKRRALLRKVTGTLTHATYSSVEKAALDDLMSVVADEYSTEVRMEFARLVAVSSQNFPRASAKFAHDTIEVAGPVLRQAPGLIDEALLDVVSRRSQAHMLAVTKRSTVSTRVFHALVENGDDAVVTSLLANDGAQIGHETFEMMARRAESSAVLHGPLVRRKEVPADILHDLYLKVEVGLRQEILEKFGDYPPEDLEKAFVRSRARVTQIYWRIPPDYQSAVQHVELLKKRRQLVPDTLVSLLRQGSASLTTFQAAFAVLVDVEFDVIQRVTQKPDLDALALLCRGAAFETSLFVVLALALSPSSEVDPNVMGALYEKVPVVAAQRALRFWKASAAG
jgi:uncharacterized protein (DUF2336 family)